MYTLFTNIICWLTKFTLSLRYRITVKGLDKLNPTYLKKPGGVLFLPNHPAQVDPIIVMTSIWRKYQPRPLAVEYFHKMPLVRVFMKWVRALSVPNFETSGNVLKRKANEKVFEEVMNGLKSGDHFVIYPAAKLKRTPEEIVGGASGVHRILQECPDTNVVMVRTTGLWGSSFSWGLTGKAPPFGDLVWRSAKTLFKNLIFFCPRRPVTVEFCPVGEKAPLHKTRREFNLFLEDWYNQYDNPENPKKEATTVVSYAFWKQDLPEITYQEPEKQVDVASIPEPIRKRVLGEIARISGRPVQELRPEMDLSMDLSLDSLDQGELTVFLDDEFDVTGVQPIELATVGVVMEFAAGMRSSGIADDEDEEIKTKVWHKLGPKKVIEVPNARTIPEAFLRSCDHMGKQRAMADQVSGVLSYKKMKLAALLMADVIKQLPGKNIGIMLPASVGANVLVFGAMLAGKTPVMLNWTIGGRHLASVKEQAGIEAVLTSFKFLDRLDNVDLSAIEDNLILMEDVKAGITLGQKLRALRLSWKKPQKIMKTLGLDRLTEHDVAVYLFTSGSEALPKGVPLSHNNMLMNLRGILSVWTFTTHDSLLSMLPPFHSFGFVGGCLLSALTGLSQACFPDPTDGLRLAKAIDRWDSTMVASAPSFLKGILASATPEQLKSLRVVVVGAEKTPQDTVDKFQEMVPGVRLAEAYGITECGPCLSLQYENLPPKGVGRALPGVELRIIHPETHETLGSGQRGLIIANGPNIFGGYLNSDRDPFIQLDDKTWYNTGDLGFLDEEGNLTISGRLKRFVKVGGEMISLTSVESALIEAAPSKGWKLSEEGPSFALCAIENPGEKAFFHLSTVIPLSVEEVNETLKNLGFSNLSRINEVEVLEEIPVAGTGKVNYRLLEDQLKSKNPIS